MKAGVLYLFFALLVSSCSKDPVTPDPQNPPPGSSKKLSKIAYDDGSYESIAYNSNGSIKTIINHIAFGSSTPIHVVYDFVYSGSQVSEVRGDDGSKFKYTYDANNKLSKTEMFSTGGNLIAWYAYTYDANGKLWKTEGYTRAPGGGVSTTPTLRYENEYYANGNLKKLTLYFKDANTGALDKTNEFVFSQYDTNPNTTAVFETNPYLPMESFIPNNPLSEIHYDSFGNVEETVAHTYTYDAGGYPLTRKTVTKSTGFPDTIENATFSY